MPDLSLKSSHAFWHAYPDPSLYRVIAFMEGMEEWTLDGHPEVEAAFKKLGDTLQDIGKIDLKQEDAMIDCIAQVKTSRGLHTLMSLDNAYPGSASKIIMKAEKDAKKSPLATLFIQRNIVFERLRLLSRMLAPERLQLITQALEEATHG